MVTPETFELTLRARPENLARIAAFIADVARQWNLTPRETFHIQMAVDEACTNIIQHSYQGDESGVIELTCQQTGDACIVTIHDYGRAFDPDAVPEPDVGAPLEDRPIGGLGLFFMRQLMDEVRFEFDEQRGNVLTMVKYRKAVVTRTAEKAEDITVVTPRGRLDADMATELESTFGELLAEGRYRLIVDFTRTSYISSTGLRVLLMAVRQAQDHGGDVKLFGMQPHVLKVFQLTGFTRIFSIFESEAAAVEAFREGGAGAAEVTAS